MSVLSGKSGSLTLDAAPVANFKNWKLKTEYDGKTFRDSSTAGWEDDVDGFSKGSGTFEMNLDAGAFPTIVVGATPAAIFLLDTGKTKSATIRITSIDVNNDYEGAAPQSATVGFRLKGALT